MRCVICVCKSRYGDNPHCGIHAPRASPPPPQEPQQPKIGEDAWLELVAKTNESLTLEQRQNITAVLEAVDTALNKDRDGVKAIAARLLEQQRKLTAAASRIAQLERENRDWRESATVVRAALTQAQQERDVQPTFDDVKFGYESEIAVLRAQKSALMEAIEPFVKLYADDSELPERYDNLARVYEQVKEKI